jgi:hypothetical protein
MASSVRNLRSYNICNRYRRYPSVIEVKGGSIGSDNTDYNAPVLDQQMGQSTLLNNVVGKQFSDL